MNLNKKIKNNIQQSIKECIKCHGQITNQNLQSALKRIAGNLGDIFISIRRKK